MAGVICSIEYANLNDYPTQRFLKQTDDAQFTLGDLHGNALKFLYFLIVHGVVQIIPEENADKIYNEIVILYNTPPLRITISGLNRFHEIIDKHMTIAPDPPRITLIGDMLADRGMNDYYTLYLLKKLGENRRVPLEILFSNHDYELYLAYEKNAPTFKSENMGLYPYQDQVLSMTNLQRFIDYRLVSRNEVNQWIKAYYLPSLKALSYTIDRTGTEPTIRLYTHAPVGFDIIKELAVQFGVFYQDNTVDELAQTIDRINERFTQYIHNKTLNYAVGEFAESGSPLYRLMWNRDPKNRPAQHPSGNYRICYVHGHDFYHPSDTEHTINLDNLLGKGNGLSMGTYTALCTEREQGKQNQLTPTVETSKQEADPPPKPMVPFSDEELDELLSQLTMEETNALLKEQAEERLSTPAEDPFSTDSVRSLLNEIEHASTPGCRFR